MEKMETARVVRQFLQQHEAGDNNMVVICTSHYLLWIDANSCISI